MTIDLENKIKGLPRDLSEIELTNSSETIKGKGSISLGKNGIIELKIYVDNPKPVTIESIFKEINQNKDEIGKLIPEESYYSFKGNSANNEEYTCSRVWITDHENHKIYSAEICSELKITNSSFSEKTKVAKVEIPYKIKIPKNHVIESQKKYSDKWTSRNVSLELFEVTFENKTIDILSEEDRTVVLIQYDDYGKLEEEIPLLIDALGFVTATLIDRYVIEYRLENGKFKTEFHYFHKQRQSILYGQPPLAISSSIKRENYTSLFSDFFKYLSCNRHEQLIETFNRIISAQNTFITVYALTLTTAIETVINEFYPSEPFTIPKKEIDSAIEEINGIKILDSLKSRIIGMLGNIAGQVRADDVIKDLVSIGLLSEKLRSNWKTLRNSVNHGKNPTPDFQELINLCENNLVLYYSLILNLINYKGQFTDYSTYGYPLISLNKK
jgi:hypothetical protein